MWKTLRSEIVFEHRRLTLVEDEVRMDSGHVAQWLRHADAREGVSVALAVTAVCVRPPGEVLVAEQYCHAPQERVAEFPGGTCESKEEAEAGLRRELAEEAGLRPRLLLPLGTILVDNRRSSAEMAVYLAHDFDEVPRAPDLEEDITYQWVDERVLDARIRSGLVRNPYLLAAWCLYKTMDPERGI